MSMSEQLDVLVVDDTTVSRALICDALDQLGVKKVRVAKDGENALKVMLSDPAHLVLSDFEMPKLNGLQLLQSLRANKSTQKVGFVLITGRGEKAIVEQGKKLGMNNFLAKPFTVPKLKTCIEQIFGRKL